MVFKKKNFSIFINRYYFFSNFLYIPIFSKIWKLMKIKKKMFKFFWKKFFSFPKNWKLKNFPNSNVNWNFWFQFLKTIPLFKKKKNSKNPPPGNELMEKNGGGCVLTTVPTKRYSNPGTTDKSMCYQYHMPQE